VADAYDAMTCDRSYRIGLLREAAVKEIEAGAGSQFDPEIAAVFLTKVLPELTD
jgi:HD-GYP domain-containing protein (c-di-GMP phosphodiesterase class II)